VSFGVSDASWHYRQSGPAGTDTAISLDLPLRGAVGLKAELGTVTWAFNGQIGRELWSDDLTSTRLTLSYVGRTRPHSMVTIFWRAGGGYYHFSSATTNLNRHHRLGAHGGAGVELPAGRRVSVATYALHHVIPGRTLRLSGTSTSIHNLRLVSAAVDLRVHF
jgi:hypothetical protein